MTECKLSAAEGSGFVVARETDSGNDASSGGLKEPSAAKAHINSTVKVPYYTMVS